MSGKKLYVEIVTPEKLVYAGEVDMVVAQGDEGELGILPLHMPLITTLKVGELRLKIGDRQDYIAVHGGYLEVREDRVTVLADAAELASEIDVKRAEKAKEEAEKNLALAKENGEDIAEAQKALEKATLRLRLARKSKK